jgi:uncharacterized protein
MKPVFADTFYFLALINQRDAAHALAVQARSLSRSRPLVTSHFVLLETADFLCDPPNRSIFGAIVDSLRHMTNSEIVIVDQTTLDAAIDLYKSRPDKSWSLTDCTSFIIMQQRGLTQALTGDHHFEQAGFETLLKVRS